jgi:hypothetical protein
MGKSAASSLPTQPPTHPRPTSACVVGQERGFRCLPVIPGTAWCQKHHPDYGEERRRHAREAARARIVPPPPVDDELGRWLESLDFTTEAGCRNALVETARRVGKRLLPAGIGREIRLAAADALKSFAGTKTKASRSPVLVEVQRFGRAHGSEAGA